MLHPVSPEHQSADLTYGPLAAYQDCSNTPCFGLRFCLRPVGIMPCMRSARHRSHARCRVPLDDHLIYLILTQSAIVLLYSLSPYTCHTRPSVPCRSVIEDRTLLLPLYLAGYWLSPEPRISCVLLYLISLYFPIVVQQSEYHLGPALCPSASPSHSLSLCYLVHPQSALLRLCSILPDPSHIQAPATFIRPLLQSPLPVLPCKLYNTMRTPVQSLAELYPTAILAGKNLSRSAV